jgi:glycosyltransferase involved in cell wall biosynthesis
MLNIIAPYRLPLIKELAKHFHVRVMVSKTEDNRAQLWDTYVVQEMQKLSIEWEKVLGITIILQRIRRGERFDQRYIHINPGYFLSLFRFHPDVIITLEMGFRSIVALLYGFLFHKPVWVWWGGTLHTESSIGFIKRNWRKIFVKIVPRWISYGQLSTEYLLSLGVPRKKILQIQNCIDESLFRVKYVQSLQIEPRPVLLYVGQLVKRKGIDLLLQAASKVQQKGLKFSLMLVGSGPEEENLKKMAQELGLSNIYFFGGKSYSEIPSIYKNADVLVLPTLEDVWGIVVNEALWSGLPVLVSKYAGCATEIVPETNIFDPMSPEEFESGLERAIRGEIAPPDLSRLLTCNEVASLIIEDIKRTINEDISHP